MKSMWPIFNNEMLIYQSKANLDEKILFGGITHHSDPEIKKTSIKVCMGIAKFTFHSGP